MQSTGMQGSIPGASATARADEGVAGRVSEVAQQTMQRVSTMASQAADRLSERGEELWALQGRAVDVARAYIREHPLATIAIALAVGLLVSRLTTRD